MITLTIIVGILFGIILLALAAPVRIRFVLRGGAGEVRFRYLWIDERIFPGTKSPVDARKPTERPRESKGTNVRILWRHRPTLRRLWRVLMRLLGRLIRAWRLESGDVRVRFGTGDPANTGIAFGYIQALRGILRNRWPQVHGAFEPDFVNRVWSVEGELVFRIIPMIPLWHLLRALAEVPWRAVWKLKREMA